MRTWSPWLVILASALGASSGVLGCSSDTSGFPDLSGDDGGSGSSSGGSGQEGGSGSSSGGGSGSSSGSGGGFDSGTQPGIDAGAGSSSGGSVDSSTPVMDSSIPEPDTGMVTSSDGFAASRQACIDKINALRATNTAVALQPLTLYNVDATNTCVDTQASQDQQKNSAHWSFINNSPSCTWGSPSGWAQDECLQGYGTSPSGIEACLQAMWDERLQPNCAGCVGCTQFGGNCPNCDYSGMNGGECGHYVNMSAPYFTQVACGFAGAAPSSSDGWSVQNFQ